jgi:hypothetical protein
VPLPAAPAGTSATCLTAAGHAISHRQAIFPNATDKQGPGRLRLTAAVPGPVPSCPAPPAGEVGVAYRDTLTMPGGTGPFAWSVWAGSLPAGVTLDAPRWGRRGSRCW